jgi:acetyl-CoA carboxylase carboxyl transferase subunit alpha
MSEAFWLDFERPVQELEEQIAALRAQGGTTFFEEIEALEARATALRDEIFRDLTPWQKVQLSRHPRRPYFLDYAPKLFPDFFELHGDRAFADDAAIVGGVATFRGRPIVVLGHQKGRGTKDNVHRNFGMPRPEGYRKARRLMELADRFARPILTFIDTPGAYPGIDAEARGQSQAIAENLVRMAELGVPMVTVILGEGGSGGALAMAMGNRVLMLSYAIYSVISPEGCASILWKDAARASEAAAALRVTASELRELGVVDEVIEEPEGGAHRDVELAASRVGDAIARHLEPLLTMSPDALREDRHAKFRRMGPLRTVG